MQVLKLMIVVGCLFAGTTLFAQTRATQSQPMSSPTQNTETVDAQTPQHSTARSGAVKMNDAVPNRQPSQGSGAVRSIEAGTKQKLSNKRAGDDE